MSPLVSPSVCVLHGRPARVWLWGSMAPTQPASHSSQEGPQSGRRGARRSGPGPGARPGPRTRSGRTPAVQASRSLGGTLQPGQLGWGQRPRVIRREAAQGPPVTCRAPASRRPCRPRHVLDVCPMPGRAWDWAGWAVMWDRRLRRGHPRARCPPDTARPRGSGTPRSATRRSVQGPEGGSGARRRAGSGFRRMAQGSRQRHPRAEGAWCGWAFPARGLVRTGGRGQWEACHCHRPPASPQHQPPGLPAPLPRPLGGWVCPAWGVRAASTLMLWAVRGRRRVLGGQGRPSERATREEDAFA